MHTESKLSSPEELDLINEHDSSSVPYKKIKKICCIGAGYVGGPTCSIIAAKNPDIEVVVVDISANRIAAWQHDELPIHEPNLLPIVKYARDGTASRPANLFFRTTIKECITAADLVFVSVNTPTKTTGAGKGRAPELSYVELAIRMIAEASTSDKIIVEKSTVPVRTAEAMREILLANSKPGVRFEILSNPEFLAEGTAVENLMYPDRILIGSLNTQSGLSAAASLADVYAAWVPRNRIITMNLWSAELAKLAANCLLAQRISSINALSAICERTGADVSEVALACGLDSRIGPRMLSASVGFGGSCFKKDILSLSYIAESLGLPEVATYWRAVHDINENQKSRFAKRIVSGLYGNLAGKRIAILGFAYKKDTGDTRESPAISIIADLVNEGAEITVYDPKAHESSIWKELELAGVARAGDQKIYIKKSASEACVGASAAVIITEWDEFSNKDVPMPLQVKVDSAANGLVNKRHGRVDWAHIATLMARPMHVFDGRNITDVGKLRDLGFLVECIGNVGKGGKIVDDHH